MRSTRTTTRKRDEAPSTRGQEGQPAADRGARKAAEAVKGLLTIWE
jgi:hypothetical protein